MEEAESTKSLVLTEAHLTCSRSSKKVTVARRGNATEDEDLEVTGGEERAQDCQDFGSYGQLKDMHHHASLSKIPLSEEHK